MYWFIASILVCVILANLYPSLGETGGLLKPELTIKYGAVGLICFISGLSISVKEIIKATTSFKVHIFVLIFTFIVFPALTILSSLFLNIFSINKWILKGMVIMSCMPPSVSSAVILTRAAGGNEAAAIFISIVGSVLGIFFTPIAVLSFLGTTAVVSLTNTLIAVCETVLLPILLGQAVQYFGFIARSLHKLPLSEIGQVALLLIIFTAFCDSFTTHDAPMNASDILITFVLVVMHQVGVLYTSYKGACFFDNLYSREDIVAITYCSTNKSLTLGVPMLRILFAGYSHFSMITLPLLVYHPTQIMLGGFLAPMLKLWVNKKKSRNRDQLRNLLFYPETSHEKFHHFRLKPRGTYDNCV